MSEAPRHVPVGDPEDRIRADVFDRPWFRKVVFVGLPAVVLVLVWTAIAVSTLEVRHTVVVTGQSTWWGGHTTALRIALMDDRNGLFLPTRVDAVLQLGGTRHALFSGDVVDAADAVHRTFAVPAVSDTTRGTLRLKITFDDRLKFVTIPITVRPEPLRDNVTMPPDASFDLDEAYVVRDGARMHVLPEDKAAPVGIPSLLFVWAHDPDGAPRAVSYALRFPSYKNGTPGAAFSGATDSWGLDALMATVPDVRTPATVADARSAGEDDAAQTGEDTEAAPQTDPVRSTDATATSARQNATAGDAAAETSDAVLYLHGTLFGLRAFTSDYLANPGDPVRVVVRTAGGPGPVYLDWFREGQWLGTQVGFAGRNGLASFSVRPGAQGLIRFQAYTSLWPSNTAVATCHAYVLQSGQSRVAAVKELLRTIPDTTYAAWSRAVRRRMDRGRPEATALSRLAAFALSRHYRGTALPERIAVSRQGDDAQLTAFKRRVQTGVTAVIVLLGLVVGGAVVLAAWQAHRRQSALWAMEEEAAPPTWDTAVRIAHVVLLFCLVVAAFAAVGVLVMTLRWNGPASF